MDQIYIEKMAAAVVDALGLPSEKIDDVRAAIQTVWVGRIAVVWTREDVVRACAENGWTQPSALECEDVLNNALLDENGQGVTMDSIVRQIRQMKLDRRRRDAGPDASEIN